MNFLPRMHISPRNIIRRVVKTRSDFTRYFNFSTLGVVNVTTAVEWNTSSKPLLGLSYYLSEVQSVIAKFFSERLAMDASPMMSITFLGKDPSVLSTMHHLHTLEMFVSSEIGSCVCLA